MTERLMLAQISVDINALKKQMQKAGIAVDTSATRMEKRWNRSTQKMTRDTEQFGRDVRRAILAIGLGSAITEVGQLADAWTEASNQIGAASQVAGVASVSLSRIADISRDTRTEFSATATLYARLTRATADLGVEQGTLLQATSLINQAFKAGGASAQEQESAILQLSQALSSGVLQGDELRSIRESSPIILQAIAKEFNTTTGALKELGAQGELVSSRIFSAILNAAPEISAQFAITQSTVADSYSNLKTAATEYIGTTDRALGISRGMSDVVNKLADNFSSFGDSLLIAITLLGARGLGGVLNSVASDAANLIGTMGKQNREMIRGLQEESREATRAARRAVDSLTAEQAALRKLAKERASAEAAVRKGPRLSAQYAKDAAAADKVAAAERRLNKVLESSRASAEKVANAKTRLTVAEANLDKVRTKQFPTVAKLIALNSKYTAQISVVTAAQTRLAQAQTLAAGAARNLSRAMNSVGRAGASLTAFFGGPIGVLITGVGAAMAYYNNETIKAERATNAISTALGILSSANFDSAENANLSAEAAKELTTRLENQKIATQALAEIERERAKVQYGEGIKAARDEVARLQDQIATIKFNNENGGEFFTQGSIGKLLKRTSKDLQDAQKGLPEAQKYLDTLEQGLAALEAVNYDLSPPAYTPTDTASPVDPDKIKIDIKAAKDLIAELQQAYYKAFETESDLIKRTYTERLQAIKDSKLTQEEADAARTQAQAIYFAEMGKLYKEAEDDAAKLAADREQAAANEISDLEQVIRARDQMLGRFISISAREYAQRKKDIEANIADEVRRVAALNALAEEQAAFENYAIQNTKGLDERSDPQAQIEQAREIQRQKLEALQDFQNSQIESEIEFAALRIEIERDTQAEIMAIRAASAQMQLSGAQSLFSGLASLAAAFAGESSGIYKALFLTEKAFALASAYVQMNLAVAKASASAPPPLNAPAILAARITGIGAIAGIAAATIAGFKGGGYTGAGDPNEVAGEVHRGEYVFNAKQTKQLGVNNLKALAQGQVPRGGTIASAITGGGGGRSYSFGDTVISVSGNGADEIRAELADTLAAHRRGIISDIERGFPKMAAKDRTRATPRHERGRL